jgi:hypothetical protein
VQETIANSPWDTILFGIPFIALLFLGFFRLDQVFASRNQSIEPPQRAFSGLDEDGEPIVRDPDGRLSGRPRVRR